MTAYYNEIDPYAAQWLRNLITAGHIAPGYVDERSIEDVYPSDLRGFTQCHFFAGIGVWSHALRSAGWRDDRPVWTGSCPCQPFSAAGKGSGFADERHLWPAFHHLIRELRPAVVLGEQVASKDADPWIDLVCHDVEALDYAFGAIPFPSAGVGAPHIRDRLYWVAHPADQRFDWGRAGSTGDGRDAARQQSERLCDAGGMADDQGGGWREERSHSGGCRAGDGAQGLAAGLEHGCDLGGMEYAGHHDDASEVTTASAGQSKADRPADQFGRPGFPPGTRPGPTGGFWADADWLFCRDGKWRPVEPGTFPLAHGAASRVGRLRAYGNAINAEAARAFIECVMETQPTPEAA